jgi:hypothetical protein
MDVNRLLLNSVFYTYPRPSAILYRKIDQCIDLPVCISPSSSKRYMFVASLWVYSTSSAICVITGTLIQAVDFIRAVSSPTLPRDPLSIHEHHSKEPIHQIGYLFSCVKSSELFALAVCVIKELSSRSAILEHSILQHTFHLSSSVKLLCMAGRL